MEITNEVGAERTDGLEDIPETVYCTPEDVAEALDLPDPSDNFGTFMFSDVSHPSVKQVCRMIRANEDVIDRRLRRSWRENRVVDQILDVNTYWHDLNSWRADYYIEGGDYILLRHDILPWNPIPVEEGGKGDKLEFRTRNNQWVDVSQEPLEGGRTRIWFDYQLGKMYVRTRFFQPRYNAIRITYRYGCIEQEPPYAIRRLCALMTASQVINMQAFNIKVGMGGDISGVKESIQRNWADEMAGIWASYQRSGSVHSLMR